MPDISTSRIFGLNEERPAIVAEVIQRVLDGASRSEASIELAVNDTAYHEIARLEGDKKREAKLQEWKELYRALGRRSAEDKRRILEGITARYANDIVGNFDPRVYRFATGVVPRGLKLLFKGRDSRYGLEDRITIQGQVEALQGLIHKGTVILVPTHSSNLDSIVVGWALDAMGLPPFTYGAGKNLFSNFLLSFFMHNLGAYKVDRRLKDKLYKDTLKTYSTVILERGYHSLFFPGGTRSRSGGIERKLKLGLMGTGLAAYINNLKAGKAQPNIYFVPMTINYPLVLEGQSQVDDFLKIAGKSRYIIEDDESSRLGRIAHYTKEILGFDGKMLLQVGQAIDPFGNAVDAEGVSRDMKNRAIDIRKYVEVDGKPEHDAARDTEYTRELGVAIGEAFGRNNVVLSTHMAAFVAFELVKAAHPGRDIYHLVRLPGDTTLSLQAIYDGMERLRDRLVIEMAAGRILLSPTVQSESIEHVLRTAQRYFTMYHEKDLAVLEGEHVRINDVKLLFYYHNRLSGYGLEKLFEKPAVAHV
ncbi:MAG: Glycerol-3-phosphate acyltransferase [Cyanobacteria bacterium RYN_339]|nr:Glycerol-3-phosphate acyltransferase [Cyanobacteria bacterium RYN_339]